MRTELFIALMDLIVDGAEKISRSKSYTTFRKHGTECSIETRFECDIPIDYISDVEGNEYAVFYIDIKVNYQAHGGTDIKTVEERARFVLDCCAAATRIKNQFYGKMVYSLYRSKEDKIKRQQELEKETVFQAVKGMFKGMRVGAEKVLFADNLISGTYELEFNKNLYTVVVAEANDQPTAITRIK